MALHLSRARRETISVGSPTSSATPQLLRDAEHGLSSLSYKEQHDLDLARGDTDEEALSIASPVQEEDDDLASASHQQHFHSSSPRMAPSLMNMDIRGPQDPSLLVKNTSTLPPSVPLSNSRPNSPPPSHLALPTYQATTADPPGPQNTHNLFDFGPMEDFGAEEKKTLGLNSPTTAPPRFSLSQITRPSVRKQQKAAASAEDSANNTGGGDDNSGPETPTLRARQRKLSQSNSPRHRKGIGGKLALFEAAGNGLDPMSSRLGSILGSGASPLPGDDSGVMAPGPSTSGGILNTGHDRPYRFSFYSNSLGATIHARSLSELPAEGQSFGDLFRGVVPGGGKKTRPNSTYRGGTGGAQGGYFSGPKVPSAGAQGVLGLNGAGGDDEISTWWLDITSPTDEEMKMLSKVIFQPLWSCFLTFST